jgi:hypothetical protein
MIGKLGGKKKMRKSEIYAAYGIEYVNGKIKAPNGDMIAPLLKKGNSKTGTGVYTYSQLAGNKIWDTKYGPIKGTCPCQCDHCYACVGFYCMPSVRDALAVHTIITRSYLEFKKAAIIAQIKADKITTVRIHASGDFDSIQDVNIWLDIVKACPDTLFWTYTKRAWDEIELLNSIDNINIVPSIVAGRVNFGTCPELLELKEAVPSAYICPCGFDENTHCENCKACALEKNVIFLLHSTPDYSSIEDPLYNTLKGIFEEQEARKNEY